MALPCYMQHGMSASLQSPTGLLCARAPKPQRTWCMLWCYLTKLQYACALGCSEDLDL
jgi:hypothetical protein